MVSHRAGRWAFDEPLRAVCWWSCGYQVDCSVTPRVNWQHREGCAAGRWRDRIIASIFRERAYFPGRRRHQPARATRPLLEVPMSIQYKHPAWLNCVKQGYDRLRGKVRIPSLRTPAATDGRQCGDDEKSRLVEKR